MHGTAASAQVCMSAAQAHHPYLVTGVRRMIVRPLLFVALLGVAGLASAQVHFDSGSARPNNPDAATRKLAHRGHVIKTPPHSNRARCRDGSVHTVRVCERHGGVAKR